LILLSFAPDHFRYGTALLRHFLDLIFLQNVLNSASVIIIEGGRGIASLL
jgi:hypothetical protein